VKVDWQPILAVAIDGEPMPAPRARAGQGRVFMPAAYRAHRRFLAGELRRARKDWEPLRSVAFAVKVRAFRSTRHRVDVDNVLKTVMDAGTGIIWDDDSQIVWAHVERLLDRERPRMELRIWWAALVQNVQPALELVGKDVAKPIAGQASTIRHEDFTHHTRGRSSFK
jgi:crossover junction endodeoxyribonuclease RusA